MKKCIALALCRPLILLLLSGCLTWSQTEQQRRPIIDMHLHALNRGILLTPFHNMALMSPATKEADVDLHTEAFREAVLELAAEGIVGSD